jgi:hypothetical protein
MLALRPDVFSVAVTFRIPLTSTSKTTSRTASLHGISVCLEPKRWENLPSAHRWDWRKSELTQGGVVLAVNTLTLEDGELDSLLVVRDRSESSLLD